MWQLDKCLLNCEEYIQKNKGLNIEPRDIPVANYLKVEFTSSKLTFCCLFLKLLFISMRILLENSIIVKINTKKIIVDGVKRSAE